jgi:AMMECR1 domain-containing protein
VMLPVCLSKLQKKLLFFYRTLVFVSLAQSENLILIGCIGRVSLTSKG